MIVKPVRQSLSFRAVIFGILAVPLTFGAVRADDQHFVGSLRWATDDEGAELLGLSKDAQAKLKELVKKRIEEGRRLLATKNLTEGTKAQTVASFAQESERQGNELLTIEQREKLVRLVLAREGLLTLAREDVGRILGLTDLQRNKIRQLLESRATINAKSTGLRQQIAIRTNERKLQALLTPAQLQKWENAAAIGEEIQNKEPIASEQPAIAPKTPTKKVEEQVLLRFAFERTPWRNVIDWLAKSSDLSLHISSMPPGSLTYSDDREYTTEQAIERINRFLIPTGYTLIRSGKLISVIGWEDGRRDQMLDALAEYASVTDLDKRGDNEVVKCIFTIAKSDPEEVLDEISGLVKMSTPMLMPKSKQLLVIETVAKQKIIRRVIEAMENPSGDLGPVRRFVLNNVRAEEVLDAVRPLVGIENEKTNVGTEISLATDANGKQIFATGSAKKLAIVEGVVQMLDKSHDGPGGPEVPKLRAHPVNGASLKMVEDVLQTLLAGEKNVRLAQEPQSGRIVVLANESVHKRIEETIGQLAGEVGVFEVIQLKNVEPFVAVSVIREMFDIPFIIDDKDEKKDHPRVDWDTPSMRVFVRGTRKQVDEIKKIVEKLEQPTRDSISKGPLRLLPIHGESAQRLLETGRRFWPGNDDVQVFPSEASEEVLERVINGDNTTPKSPAKPRRTLDQQPTHPPAPKPNQPATQTTNYEKRSSSAEIFVANRRRRSNGIGQRTQPSPDTQRKTIKAQVTPRGILLHSADTELLNRFEEHLRKIAGPGQLSATRMAIFYLTHVRAENAKSLLSDFRTGQSSYGRDRTLDSDLESSRPGRSFFSYSAPSVIADSRLNRLIVQGTAAEILEIEQHLRIIDRDKSLADVLTRGKPRVIQLVHIRAADAAQIIRQTFADQLASGAPAGNQQAEQQKQAQLNAAQQQLQQLQQQLQQQQQQKPPAQGTSQQTPQPNRSFSSLWSSQFQMQPPNNQSTPRESNRRSARTNPSAQQQPATPPSAKGQQSRTQEPKMTLSVEESGNSLIIRAPDQLFEQVSELVRVIDQNAYQTTRVVPVSGVNPEYVKQVLDRLSGNPVRSLPTAQPSSPTSDKSPSTKAPAQSNAPRPRNR